MTANSKYDKDWTRLKNGDLTALEALYSAYVNAMISYGSRITSDTHLIKDAIQDLFIELWKSRNNLADIAQPKYYLFRALRNKLIRSTPPQMIAGDEELEDNQPATYIELETAEQEAALHNNLHQLLQQLPHRQQEVIYLRFYQDCSYETIADMMNMNYQSVLNLTQRALKSLRKAFPAHSPRSHY